MSMKGKIISKISTRTIMGGRPDAPPKGTTGPVWLWRIIGMATDYKTGTTDKGDWTSLVGSFQGMNIDTGELFRSGTCFLPNVVLDLVMGQLKAEGQKSVSFGFNIGIVRDEASATGYVYVADPVAEVMESDPLAPLLEKLGKHPEKAAGGKK